MKQFYSVQRRSILLFITSAFFVIVTRGQDLPGASANLQTAPAGSYVIAMDNTNQATSKINTQSGTYLFNLKAYGLAVFLLDVSYKLNWVIKAGKSKDAIDFTAVAERIFPSYLAPQSYDFLSGPILIFPADTLSASYAINLFNSWLPDSCKVKVYRLQSDVTVDVRYTLTKPPKAALLHDSCDIHRNYMEMASVMTLNYNCLPNASTLRSGCYTIVTEPHTAPSDLTSYDVDSIYSFVMAGGNFLAECEAVQTFENLKQFQSATGVILDPTGGQYNNFNNNVYYDNADMAYAQYQGTFRPWLRGAQKVWRYGSANTNNFYSATSCKRNAADNLYYVASVSKMTADTGSLVFYLGNHEYFTHDCHTCIAGNAINEQEINGIRLFLNAVLMPSKFMNCVNIYVIPLAVTLEDFDAFRQNETVRVRWSSLTEKDNLWYFVEHSVNGIDFKMIGKMAGKGDTDEGHDYEFIHYEPQTGLNYYRLTMMSMAGKTTYSKIRKVIFGNKDQALHIYPNPATGKINLMLDAKDGDRLQVRLFDVTGRLAKNNFVIIRNQKLEMNVEGLQNGIYWTVVTTGDGQEYKAKLVIAQ